MESFEEKLKRFINRLENANFKVIVDLNEAKLIIFKKNRQIIDLPFPFLKENIFFQKK